MKMSLCKSFRFIVVSTTLVLSIVGSPVPGRGHRHKTVAARDLSRDLVQQGSITVEMKNELKPTNISQPNSLKLNNAKDDTVPLASGGAKKNISKAHSTTTQKAEEMNITSFVDKTTEAISKYIINATTSSTERVSDSQPVNHRSNETVKSNSKDKGGNITTVNFSPIVDKNEHNLSQINTTGGNNRNQSEFTTIENNLITVKQMMTAGTEKTDHRMILENKLPAPHNITMVPQPSGSVTTPEPSVTTSSKNRVFGQMRKKYTVIERNRISTTTEQTTSTDSSMNGTELSMSTIYEEPTTMTEKAEMMIKSETAQARISLQDTMTSDIPSLEKLKTDLLSFPKFTTESEIDSSTTLRPDEDVTRIDTTTPFMTTSESLLDSPNTVSSKRAGYLDLSPKITSSTVDFNGLILNGTESLQGPFDAETPEIQDETPEDKVEGRMESQGQLTEDAIKEELLKEKTLIDNEENVKRNREEQQQKQTETPSVIDVATSNITLLNSTDVKISNTAPDDNLSVKPINIDKLKNTILYPVNPNYKPLKKIEVQPAKPFVRDPDDNSWRNESLSSLGIVFKPKNSSKPFTQVLKNKTETEWNTLSEKERKSEVPDLRVRLEQIAQKRKSKKKKIDSFGNVYYTDYEENSSSEENTRTSHVEDPSVSSISTTEIPTTTDITIVTPVPTLPLTSLSTTAEIKNTTTLTTMSTPTQKTEITPTPNKERNNVKTTKLFNLFDYYESSDDDDIADYLNMARIDLKKYTVPIQTTFTSLTSPPLQILYTTPISHYTSERKGTIQYFPPRTTKRPRKSKHYNSARNKINPFTLTESPKSVLPMSYHKMPTTPFDRGMYYTESPDVKKPKEQHAHEPKNSDIMDSNPYLTTSPLTTLPEESFGLIGSDGEYNRDNFVIKHYTDYMKDAGQRNEPEQDTNSDYVGLTQSPQGVTVSDFMKDATPKDNAKLNEAYDYDTQFRKDVLERFVANFNENSKRFKSDFPLLYNNSIVHAGSGYNDKDVALSRAYFRRPYSNQGDYKPLKVHEPYDPNCDNATVELSPAYELHYYVPEQEEKQEAEAKPVTLPVRFRL